MENGVDEELEMIAQDFLRRLNTWEWIRMAIHLLVTKIYIPLMDHKPHWAALHQEVISAERLARAGYRALENIADAKFEMREDLEIWEMNGDLETQTSGSSSSVAGNGWGGP